MNTKLLHPILVALLALGVGGCESSRYMPVPERSGAAPATPPTNPPATPSSESVTLAAAAAKPVVPADGADWRPLFDGRSLAGWRVTDFKQGGGVEARDGLLVFHKGDHFVGVNCTNEIPTSNYEVSLDAMRVAGDDFFCGLTFPAGDSFCSLIVGGWGGSVVGLSNLDGADASENETTQFVSFERGRWYRIRLRVTDQQIEAWIEQKKVVDVNITGRKVSLRFGDIELSKPFGLASWSTSAAFREIKIRAVTTP